MHESKIGLFYFIVPRYIEKQMLIFSVKRFIRETVFFLEKCQYYFMMSHGEYIFSFVATFLLKKKRMRNDTIRWYNTFQDDIGGGGMRLKTTEDSGIKRRFVKLS